MVGAARQHDDAAALGPGLFDDLLPLGADLGHVAVVLGVGSVGRGLHLALFNARKVLGQNAGHLAHKVLGAMDAHVIVDKGGALQLGAVARDHLGVIGHHRAVVMVLAQALIQIVGEAGVEDGV